MCMNAIDHCLKSFKLLIRLWIRYDVKGCAHEIFEKIKFM